MRKKVSIVLTLILMLTLASAAFAGQSSDYFVFYGDSQVGTVTDGYHGYSWNHSDSNAGRIVKIKKALKDYHHRWGNKWYRNLGYERNEELYSYVDDNGVSHYFYLDPDRYYEVHQYKDQDGITQFWFEDKGWK